MDKIYKTFEISEKKTIDADAGIYEAWISTESVDRDNDILLADGVVLDNYRKNPVVLFGHNYMDVEAIVGKALEVEPISGKGIRARWQFTSFGDNPKADIVHRLWAGEFLNATSVGFTPKQFEKRTDEDGEPLDRGYLFTEWELLEFSIVPVPANQDALRLAVKAIESDLDVHLKPYPNEHACRLRNPSDFESDSFRRVNREHEGKRYSVIMGRLRGQDTMTEQAYRYPKDIWKVEDAKKHSKSHDGQSFEPASDNAYDEQEMLDVEQEIESKVDPIIDDDEQLTDDELEALVDQFDETTSSILEVFG